MKVILANPRGFCAGVVRAIDIVELSIQNFGSPIYVRHEIVHNPHVVNDLKRKGAIFVNEVADVPEGAILVFSAHGVSPEVRKQAVGRKIRVIDATCPLVTKVHLEAVNYASKGYQVILIGHRAHDEIIGTMGEVPDATIIIESIEDVPNIQIQDKEKIVALTQTTLSVEDTKEIVSTLKKRFPQLITRNDICYATTNRQMAVKQIAKDVELVLVIGAENSSNCNRLKEAAERAGAKTLLINGPEQITDDLVSINETIGIISGASTPENLVESIIDKLNPSSVTNTTFIEEKVTFNLPKEVAPQA